MPYKTLQGQPGASHRVQIFVFRAGFGSHSSLEAIGMNQKVVFLPYRGTVSFWEVLFSAAPLPVTYTVDHMNVHMVF